jgi:hypothetical protein
MPDHFEASTYRGLHIAAGIAAATVAEIAVVAVVLVLPYPARVARIGPATIAIVAVALACCGGAFSGVVRALSARPASVGEWFHRAAVGVVLLTPALVYVTWAFDAPGWDAAGCGSLIARYRPAGTGWGTFSATCDAAAQARLLRAIMWAGMACVAAAAYGLVLRWRRGARTDPPR